MSSRKLRRALPPAFFALGACTPVPTMMDGGPDNGTCTVIRVPDAGVVTYTCQEGGQCSSPNAAGIDGGAPYQVCPGPNGCATLVAYDGSSMIGFC